jgi:antirestriction protein ArdC
VTPRTARFYAAVAVLTLGFDIKIANAVRDLTPAVGALLEVIAADEKKYARARARAEKALGNFRTVADQRQRGKP